MKKTLSIFFLLLPLLLFSQSKFSTSRNMGFMENKGQIHDQDYQPNPDVKYLLNLNNGLNVQLRKNGFSYDTYIIERTKKDKMGEGFEMSRHHFDSLDDYEITYHFHRIDIELLNANPNPEIIAENPSEDYLNFYNAVTPEEGATYVRTYQKVTYRNIYPGIDLEFFVQENAEQPFKYNFIIHPSADINDIKIQYKGANSLKLQNGQIQIDTSNGEFYESIPESWLLEDNSKVDVVYKEIEKGVFGFEVENGMKGRGIVVDPLPILDWATYYGSVMIDDFKALVNDDNDNIYFTGFTSSYNNIATYGAYQTIYGGNYDVFLLKVDSAKQKLWATYFGGTSGDFGQDIYFFNNSLFLTGYSGSSSSIATPNAYKDTLDGQNDAILIKFNENGQRIWGTYFGGTGQDQANAIDINTMGNIIIGGSTNSTTNISTPSSFQTSIANTSSLDGFICVFDSSGQVNWSSYYGGRSQDVIRGIDHDRSNNIYFTGYTQSNTMISSSTSFQSNYGGGLSDGFLTKFDLGGQRIWSTYYGGSSEDDIYSVKIDNHSNIYISGFSTSTNNISSINAYQTNLRINDAIIVKLDSNGSRIWGTYYGGNGGELFKSIDLDDNGNLYLIGQTNSSNSYLSTSGFQPYFSGQNDVLVTKFTPLGNRLWSTFFGGSSSDYGYGIVVLNNNKVIIAGNTYSNDSISTFGAFQSTYSGNTDVFIAELTNCYNSFSNTYIKFCESFNFNGKILNTPGTYYDTICNFEGCDSFITLSLTYYSKPSSGFAINDSAQCISGNNFIFTNTSSIQNDTIAGYFWDFGDGDTSTLANPTHSYSTADTFEVMLVATSQNGCRDSITRQVIVFPKPVANIWVNDSLQCEASNNFVFTDSSTISSGNIATNHWYYKFGDTTNQDTFTISYPYALADTIGLILASDQGCVDTTYQTVSTVLPPNIISQSLGDTLCEGDSTNLFVSASGYQPLTYQWKLDSQNIIGATDSNYLLNPALARDSGSYMCVVSNMCGKDTTEIIPLIVNQHPEIKLLTDLPPNVSKPVFIWQKCLGGTSTDRAFSMVEARDGYLIAVELHHNNGIVTCSKGTNAGDIWIVKLDTASNILWQKCYGGTDRDWPWKIIKLRNEEAYVISGYSESDDGDLSSNNGYSDYWILKIDSVGNIVWQNSFGGSLFEEAKSVIQTLDGGFLIAGHTRSNDFDIDTNYGFTDNWLIKLSGNGTLEWKKVIGDSLVNSNCDIVQDKDSNIYLSMTTEINYPANCYLNLIKTTNNGQIIWWKIYNSPSFSFHETNPIIINQSNRIVIGGKDTVFVFDTSGYEILKSDRLCTYYINSIFENSRGDYYIAGTSGCSSVMGYQGNSDSYVAKLDRNLNLIWEHNYGGTNTDYAFQITQDKYGYVIFSGMAGSESGHIKNHNGNFDGWVVKLWDSTVNYRYDVCEYDSLFIEVSVKGTQPLSIQWLKNGVPISGANSTTFSISSVVLSDTGIYTCVASNMCSSDTLKRIYVYVHPIPQSSFDISDTDQCFYNHSFDFMDNSSIVNNDSLIFYWSFGDSTFANGFIASHAYSSFDTFSVKLITETEYGCKDSMTKSVYVRPEPQAAFSVNDTAQCMNSNLFTFTNNSTVAYGTINSLWDFDDGNGATKTNTSNIYSTDDTFNVKLTVNTEYGCKDSAFQTIITHPSPNPTFSINDTGQCLSTNNFIFNNQSTINAGTQNFKWYFGDGDSSDSQNPTHNYSTYDTFAVLLLATSNLGCKDTISTEVYLYPHPQTDFTINQQNQCFKGHQFTFTNTTTIPYGNLSHGWDFDDGQISNAINASHGYSIADTYLISLRSVSDMGCGDSSFKNVYVYPTPEPSFSLNDSAQCLFDNSFSFSNQSNILNGTQTFLWEFGDGSTSTQSSPTHQYNEYDTFLVTLHAISNLNCQDSISRKIIVFPMPVSIFNIIDSAQCLRNNSFIFNNTSNIPYGSLNYFWDFGNSDTSSIKNPVYIYPTYDTFTVRLISESDQHCFDTAYRQSIVHPMPKADYFIWDTSQCFERNAFEFTNQTSIPYGSLSYFWQFGDGISSTQTSPIHSYMYPDTFDVHLLAVSGNGCRDSLHGKVYIHVHPEPVADFSILDSAQCLSNNLFDFTNLSNISIGSFTQNWYFGDGDTSAQLDPTHSYLNYDTLNVRMLIISDWLCKDSIEKTVVIHPMPQADFTIDTNSLCLNNNIFNFTDQSNIPYGRFSLNWDFGDGSSDTQSTTSNVYKSVDTFTIQLMATSANQCKDSMSRQVFVRPMPVAAFDIPEPSQCLYDNLFQFNNQSTVYYGTMDYSWDFGDTDTDTQTSPTHQYQSFDTFYTTLIANTNYNCKDTLIKEIVVQPMPVASFSIKDSAQCFYNNFFEFLNLSTIPHGQISTVWDFDDYTLAYTKDAIHHFSNPDTFDVKLLVTSDQNCKDSTYRKAIVFPMPRPDFAINDSDQCLKGNSFDFTNLSTISYGTLDYFWNVNNEHTSTMQQFNNVAMSDWGRFPVKLVATSNQNCTDSISKFIYIYPMPVAAFVYLNNCLEDTMYFYDSSYIDSGMVAKWYWNFGDTNRSNLQNPTNIYKNPGHYGVILKVTTDNGCTDDSTRFFRIHEHVVPNEILRATVENDKDILVEWEPTTQGRPEQYTLQKSENNILWNEISKFNNDTLRYIDQNVQVDERPYWYRMTVTDSCEFEAYYSNIARTILLDIDSTDEFALLKWTPYEYWEDGVSHYQVETYDEKKETFSTLETTLDIDSPIYFTDSFNNLNQDFHCYRITALRKNDLLPSHSNVVCTETKFNIFLPTAFTPDGDGLNDIFAPTGTYIRLFDMEIYNRWGELVFESNNSNKGWDGTTSGNDCPMGAYYYQIIARGTGSQSKKMVGTVTLIR